MAELVSIGIKVRFRPRRKVCSILIILKVCIKLTKMRHHTMSCYVASWLGYSCGTEDPRTIQYGCVEGGGWGLGRDLIS